MPCKNNFEDYIQIRNLRLGPINEDGQSVAVRLWVIIGPFTFKQVSYHTKAKSLRLNAPNVKLKGSYVDIIRKKIVEEIKQMREIVVDTPPTD
jgi:hypothetical protein